MAVTRAEVYATIARELAPIADAYAAGDHARGDELSDPWVAEVLCERMDGEWAAFENVIFDVQAKLDPFNVDCMKDGEVDWPKFTRHIVRYAAKWQERATKAAISAKSKSAKSKSAKSKSAKSKRARR
jgi:hypothetical protein